MRDSGLIVGNFYDKYGSKNPITKVLTWGFFRSFNTLYREIKPSSVLDVGCGEGYFTEHIKEIDPRVRVTAVDLSMDMARRASSSYPGIDFLLASIYKLPFEDNSWDMVTAIEVLEHLEDPIIAIGELKRVAKKDLLLSVPNEPYWRIGNMLRGKYWGRWGNTPGHLQNWHSSRFLSLIKEHFMVIKVSRPFPWLIVAATKFN